MHSYFTTRYYIFQSICDKIMIGGNMTVGIICEYNPFHNGHLYHLEEIKKLFPDSKIILVMTGNFTERGVPSIIDKWKKTEIALSYGVDLVVELPFAFAVQSADTFAKAAIELLTELRVNYLVFGSESNDIKKLTEMAEIQVYSKDYDRIVRDYLKDGLNYPTALSKALYDLTGKKMTKPNDILGITYIKEILKQESHIKPLTIKRNNDYNSIDLNDSITSATSIRYALEQGENVNSYVPIGTTKYLTELHFMNDYFPFLKYKIMTDTHLEKYLTVDEGIENRIQKYIVDAKDMNDLILKIKTKRYTYNKINRMFLHILCNFEKEERFEHIEYIRVLGFTNNGRNHLKLIKDKVKVPIISNFSSIKSKMLDMEFRSTCVYASTLKEKEKIELIKAEYQTVPLIF